MEWSEYQTDIFTSVGNILVTGRDLVVLARAGTGKTTTMVEAVIRFCRAHPSLRVLTCAFNVKNARDLDGKLAHAGLDWRQASAKTLNSVGLNTCKKAWGKGVQTDGRKGRQIAKWLAEEYMDQADTNGWAIPDGLSGKVGKLATMAKITLTDPADFDSMSLICTRFAIAEDLEFGLVIRLAGRAMALAMEDRMTVDFDDQLWFPHVFRLEPWRHSLVIVDEAQDMNASQLELARKSVCRGGRLVAVGDERQCQPPGTMVRVPGGGSVPIEDLRDGDAVVAWDRHGQHIVGRQKDLFRVRVTSREYVGQMIEVRTPVDCCNTWCTPNHRWTVKTRRPVDLWAVYLQQRGDDFRVGRCQLFNKSGSLHLGQRTRLEGADQAWILSIHDSKRDASLHESLVSNIFSIPLVQFKQSIAAPNAGLLDQCYFDEFWATARRSMHLSGSARLCLTALGRDIRHPFYVNPRGGRCSRTTVMEVSACNLFPEFMQVPLENGKGIVWTRFSVAISGRYSGPVYSLDVEKHGHYIADGIVTHNSIYGWRGADSGFLGRMVGELGANTLPLPRTYRCGKLIVAEARKLVPDYEADEGNVAGEICETMVESIVDEVEPGDFILSRANAPLLPLCLELLKRKVPATIQGRDIMGQLMGLVERSECTTTDCLLEWLAKYEREELRKLVKSDADEEIIAALRDRVECLRVLAPEHETCEELLEHLDEVFTDKDDISKVTLSSVHRAKGLERDRVFMLMDTFRTGGQEDNIRYVAMTRAKTMLIFAR